MKNDVARVMRAARTPHGYTLAVWAAGEVCISAHGQPGFGAVLFFVTGATCVFGLIAWWARGNDATLAPESSWAAVHVVAIVAAAAAAWVAALLPDPWCWPVCAAASSGVFLLLHSAQDSVLRHHPLPEAARATLALPIGDSRHRAPTGHPLGILRHK